MQKHEFKKQADAQTSNMLNLPLDEAQPKREEGLLGMETEKN